MGARGGSFVLAAGGTGGHVYPAIAVAREIRRRRPDAAILFVGTRGGLEAVIVPEERYEIEFVGAAGFVGKRLGDKLAAAGALLSGAVQARRILRARRPDAVFGSGGYVALPVLLAAKTAGVPAVIHEQNSRPGVANRIGNLLARRTAVGFEAASRRFLRPAVWTGNPVREEFFRVAPLESRPIGKRLLVFGGSQGSRVLNRALKDAAARILDSGIQVVAQTGPREHDALVAALPRNPRLRLEPYLRRIWEEVEWADLVLARAGALTIAELCAAGRPSVLVPFAAATHGHQEANARDLQSRGGARVIAERDFDGGSLADEVERLFSEPEKLLRMADAAKAGARPDAARSIVDLLFEAGEAGA